MSEGDVTRIHDEDLLRRMWQQTEDFSRKKEIRAHMYRLREERLRSLYSPEPHAQPAQQRAHAPGKGVESQTHVKSFVDQSFQGLKSKEVRDAGSPPKEFTYRGQDLQELSNAGWTVESENSTTDGGRTQVKAVRADIEGRYDVEGGRGQFVAQDHERRAHTEYQDNNTSLSRDETAASTAARDEVLRKTDDGTHFSSTTSSSTSNSKVERVETKHEVPYVTRDTRDPCAPTRNSRHEQTRQFTESNDYEQSVTRNEFESAELVSRKIDYPDDRTKVVVETRCLPDGTRVTSTRREFRAPSHCTKSEPQSTTSANVTKTYSSSSHHETDSRSSKITREHDSRTSDIVDSQREADDYDFKRNQINYSTVKDDQTQNMKRNDERSYEYKTSDIRESRKTREDIDRHINLDSHKHVDVQNREAEYTSKKDDVVSISKEQRKENQVYKIDKHETVTSSKATKDDQVAYSNQSNDYESSRRTDHYEIQANDINESLNLQRSDDEIRYIKDSEGHRNAVKDDNVKDLLEKKYVSDQYQTTYQSDYNTKKISTDYSPSHQAWASTLRADTPSSIRPNTRSSSPGSKTYRSSTSSLRSSVSPDKTYKKLPSRGGSPTKADRYSPSRTITDRYSSCSTDTTTRTYASPDRKPPASPTRTRGSPDRKHEGYPQKPSPSPEKRPQDSRSSISPERKPGYKSGPTSDSPRTSSLSPSGRSPQSSTSPERRTSYGRSTPNTSPASSPSRFRQSPDPTSARINYSPDRNMNNNEIPTIRNAPKENVPKRGSVSPDRKPGYMRPTASKPTTDSSRHHSPERKSITKLVPPGSPDLKNYSKTSNISEDNYKFIDEETKMYTRTDLEDMINPKRSSLSPDRYSPHDTGDLSFGKSPDITRPYKRSPSPSIRPALKDSRSPSPPKGPVTFTEDEVDKTEKIESIINENTIYTNKQDQKIINQHCLERPTSIPREQSPSKYGTHDKKRRAEDVEVMNTTTDDIKYKSLTRHKESTTTSDLSSINKTLRESMSPGKTSHTPRETSPSKYDTYNKKHRTEQLSTVTDIDLKDNKDGTRRPKSDLTNKNPDLVMSPTKKSPRDSLSPTKSVSKDSKYKRTTNFISNEQTVDEVNRKTKDHSRQLVTPSTSPTRKPKNNETAPSTGQSSPTTSVSGFIYFSSPKPDDTIVTDLDDQEFFSEMKMVKDTYTDDRPKSLHVERSPSPSKIPCRSPSPEKRTTPPKDSLPRKSSLKKPSVDVCQVSPTEKPPSSFRVSPTEDKVDVTGHTIVKKDNPDKSYEGSVKPKPPLQRRETYEERCRKILGMVHDDKTAKEDTSSFMKSIDKNDSKFTVADFITREKDDAQKTSSNENSPDVHFSTTSQKTVTKHDKVQNFKHDKVTKIDQSPDYDIGYQKINEPEDVKPNRRTSPQRQSPEKTLLGNCKVDFPKDLNFDKTSDNPKPSKSIPRTTPSSSSTSPSRKSSLRANPEMPAMNTAKDLSPSRRSNSPEKIPLKATESLSSKYKATTEDVKTLRSSSERETEHITIKDKYHTSSSEFLCSSPVSRVKENTTTRSSLSPERKHAPSNFEKCLKTPRSSISPERKPGYLKSTHSSVTRHDEMTEEQQEDTLSKVLSSKSLKYYDQTSSSASPSKKSEVLNNLKSPFPAKKDTKMFSENTKDFIHSEREQEVLDRVQQSLRKLSPNRKEKSPIREKSPGKAFISLQSLDVTSNEEISETLKTKDNITNIENVETKSTKTCLPPKTVDESKEQKASSKPTSRMVSPTKKPISSSKQDTNKSRSISPKKPLSPTGRSQSPQVPKSSGTKPKEPVPTKVKKPAPSSTSQTEKVIPEVKKTTGATKQKSNFIKTSSSRTTTSKNTLLTRATEEPKPTAIPKITNKENVSPKKDDIKVTRTTSDTSIKTKKTSPQRMRSKPEIQVNDVTTTTSTIKKTMIKDPQTKLSPKPKSATALNTSMDDDDVIIDVEQAKSSRENSPDRICPTPISFMEDVGTPRYPDEVNEPDDEFRNRAHHIIHETESIVDDIIEISEDEELFIKKTEDKTRIDEPDECLLSVTEKVSKFTNKIDTKATKTKESAEQFKDTERQVHSDFMHESLQSDECLLSVSEKVNKFAKGPRATKDSRSPSRKIVDEYDTETVYQDNYTKLSVNDKAHLFVETAENIKISKPSKPAQKVDRPDLSNVDESLKSDDCLLSVSDKVNKFVKTAEQFLNESHTVDDKEKRVKEEYEKIMKHIVQDNEEKFADISTETTTETKYHEEEKIPSFAKETAASHTKVKDYASPNLKPAEKTPTVKITSLRSSEAVKKAKALFENIASTTKSTKDTKLTTKLIDIGIKKSPKTDSTVVIYPSNDASPIVTDIDSEVDAPPTKDRPSSSSLTRPQQHDDSVRSSPTRLKAKTAEVPRTTSPISHSSETTSSKIMPSRYPVTRAESPNHVRPYLQKVPDKVPRLDTSESNTTPQEPEKSNSLPSYQRPTKTSQMKEEKTIEEIEVSTRRGSGKFGVELRRTSVERSTVSSERRRSSTDHHQPCIEDVFDVDLLEQMLEKVVGYEQRRRIRAQIRTAKKRMEILQTDRNTISKTTKQTNTKTKSPERKQQTRSPERQKPVPRKTTSPERLPKSTPQKTMPGLTKNQEESNSVLNGHVIEPSHLSDRRQRPQSPEKPKADPKPKSLTRQPSPEKKTRTLSPNKHTPKTKTNKFSEYASAYMKKVGLNDIEKSKFSDIKTKKTTGVTDFNKEQKETTEFIEEHKSFETKTTSITKSFSERTSSKDIIELFQVNGKRSPSPAKNRVKSPTERLYQRSPSPDFKRQRTGSSETFIKTVHETDPRTVTKETIIKTVVEERPKVDTTKKEKIIKTVHEIEKKKSSKQEEKPSWVMNRNLKKISSEAHTFSTKKIETDKKYRAPSPSKVICKPIDVITSSYGPGPLDADGKPLFGIRALRNGAGSYQVKGTVIREEFHSRNGSAPEGSVSVTAYSTQPEDLERLLQTQGEPPSRIHGLAAITTTRKFGGDTGTTMQQATSKEEHASLEQFTQSDRRVSDSRVQSLEGGGKSREETVERRDDTKTKRTMIEDKREKTQVRSERVLERKEELRKVEAVKARAERRDERRTVRQSSVKSLTEKYIKSASDTSKSGTRTYPPAGLILRTANMRDSVSSDSSAHAGLPRTDSERSLCSTEDVAPPRTTTTSTGAQELSFLDSSTKVSGVQDILTRMRNADIVVREGDTADDAEARALLNKFLGASVLMGGMQGYVQQAAGQESVRITSTQGAASGVSSAGHAPEDIDLEHCWDERVLRQLLESCSDYEQRRRVRARIRALMAEQEACASAVSAALGAEDAGGAEGSDAREEEEVTVTSSVRRNSSEKTVSSSTTTKTCKGVSSAARPAPKQVSPFAKFRQLEKQNSTTSPNSARGPQSPGSPAPYFKFTDPALQASALTIKERLLQWCRDKTRDYENVKLENFSTSWADGLAFCALVHHFLPDAFDYSQLTPDKRRHNFTLAFKIADEKAGIYPLLDVDDMVSMRKPDWKCVFTYVQAIHRRFKDEQ